MNYAVDHLLFFLQSYFYPNLMNAGDLAASLDNIKEPLGAYDLANAKVAHRHSYRVDANWKLVVENYLECYH